MMPKLHSLTGGGYDVELYGKIIGFVSQGTDRKWYAKLGEFDLGQHRTRREAVEAMMDVYFT